MLDALRQHGALFRPDLAAVTGRLPSEVEEALWDGVARGLVTADGFRAVRSLLRRGGRASSRGGAGCAGCARRPAAAPGAGSAGRWSLLPGPVAARATADELAEAVAEQLAGPLGRGLPRPGRPGEPGRALARDPVGVPADGGPGHHPRRPVRRPGSAASSSPTPTPSTCCARSASSGRTGEPVQISAADPLNLTGIVLPGPRIPAIHANTVTYIDGAVPNVPNEQVSELA